MIAFLSLIVSYLVTAALVRTRVLRVLDYPNARSMHTVPVPRSGGLGIWAGALAGMMLFLAGGVIPSGFGILGGAVLIGVISMLDDLSHISTAKRLAVHIVAAAIVSATVPLSGTFQLPGTSLTFPVPVAMVLTAAFVVWMTNLYNFMDGIDGLAGGMALIGFGALGLLGHLSGHADYAAVCWIIAASAAGFLVWNIPPARIFMGDTGSSVLGYFAGAMILWADAHAIFPWWIGVLVFFPFVMDASVTLVRRMLSGKRIWEAHREHYYQRLVLAGVSNRRALVWWYAMMIFCSAGAVHAKTASTAAQMAVILSLTAVHALAVMGTVLIERRSLGAGGNGQTH